MANFALKTIIVVKCPLGICPNNYQRWSSQISPDDGIWGDEQLDCSMAHLRIGNL